MNPITIDEKRIDKIVEDTRAIGLNLTLSGDDLRIHEAASAAARSGQYPDADTAMAVERARRAKSQGKVARFLASLFATETDVAAKIEKLNLELADARRIAAGLLIAQTELRKGVASAAARVSNVTQNAEMLQRKLVKSHDEVGRMVVRAVHSHYLIERSDRLSSIEKAIARTDEVIVIEKAGLAAAQKALADFGTRYKSELAEVG